MAFWNRKKQVEKKAPVAERRHQVLAANRAFAAAAQGNLLSNWQTQSRKLDADLRMGLRAIRARSRDAAQNNDYVGKYLGMVKANVVGPAGIRLQNKAMENATTPDATANRIIEGAWADWGKKGQCDVTGRLSWHDCEMLAAETVARDGEVLVRKVKGFPNAFGFALQFLDVDHLDETYNGRAPGSNNTIRMSIELDAYERPVAYWLMVSSPGSDTYYSGGMHRVRIPADEIVHAFRATRPHQSRGIPWTASALVHLHHLGAFEEAAIVAARDGASRMGFYTKNEQGDGFSGPTDDQGNMISEVEPGLLQELPWGVDFKEFPSKYPNEVFDPFVKRALKGVASGLGVSYCNLASDLEAVNYSSIRSGTIEERDHWRILQRWMIEQFHSQIFPDWLRMALITQLTLPASKFDKFNAATFQPRGWQWVDPSKDLAALQTAEQMNITSLSQIAAEQGRDLEEVLQQKQADQKLLEKYQIKEATNA